MNYENHKLFLILSIIFYYLISDILSYLFLSRMYSCPNSFSISTYRSRKASEPISISISMKLFINKQQMIIIEKGSKEI